VYKINFTVCALIFALTIYSQEKYNPPSSSLKVHKADHPVTVPVIHKEIQFSLPHHAVINETDGAQKLFATATHKGKLNGNWKSWYANGQVCDSGKLVNNLPDGEWKHWNEKGELISIRNYNASKFHRVTDEMNRYHPKRHFYHLSTLYQQNNQAALYYIDATYSFPGKRKPEYATIKELVLSNITDHNNYKPVFEQCLHEGEFVNYFQGGVIKDSGYYKDGLKQGKWLHRDSAEGGYWHGTYEQGVKTKEWKYYDRAGKMISIIVYDARGRESWRKRIRN
jgi:antitoxin component YwqK of YwqJK toxin-antitoxin module